MGKPVDHGQVRKALALRRCETSTTLHTKALDKSQSTQLPDEFPYNRTELEILQLVFKDWMLHLAKEVNLEGLTNGLLDEIDEVRGAIQTLRWSTEQRYIIAFEIADVLIYALQIFNYANIPASDVVRNRNNV